MVRQASGLKPHNLFMSAYALLAEVSDRPGILSGLTKVLADHRANITYVDIHDAGPESRADAAAGSGRAA